MKKKHENIFFLLFAVSGFSGLIYESIWTHYLKLFLGHAAYAQTLVLGIFMGGMALGSWLCAKYSIRWKNLIAAYGLAEAAIGLFAIFFHSIFVQAINYSYEDAIPRLESATTIILFKWILSALLITPQSVLLGMTFPLMSGGILRGSTQGPGKIIAMLYFTNSIGASIGVLASGFALIRFAGLPGTVMVAGFINLVLAAIILWMARNNSPFQQAHSVEIEKPGKPAMDGWIPGFLVVSLVTGSASFIYEIGWIRMLSLVLGSSTHAFELMLSAFILGLALGGFWIKGRLDRIADPARFLSYVQIFMGLFALSTLLVYEHTFVVMQWLMKVIDRSETGYFAFNLASHAIAISVMLPATFCAGMTLPIITFLMIRQGYGEKSIGAVYTANTIGAIAGVFFAIHFGMPLLGLKGLITLGAALDMALGLLLLWKASAYSGKRIPAAATAAIACVVMATAYFVKLDPYKMASGVYRYGSLLTAEDSKLIFHEDGKTATVSLSLRSDGIINVRTNGKSDGAINVDSKGQPEIDENTTVLLAVIPMSLNPNAKITANIGLGTGLTTQTLLSFDSITQVDTVEIETEMVKAAKLIGRRVEAVYTDPRSRIYIDDAKTFFSARKTKYDIIISEPSNPWVSGVAGLFSEEFYHLIKRNLADNGLFVQWLQLYEIDVNLIMSVLKAMSLHFSDFIAYAAHNGDMIIVAKENGVISGADSWIFRNQKVAEDLRRINIESMQDIDIRKIGNKKFLHKLVESSPIKANSDYYPILGQNAARARFLNADAYALHNLSHEPLPTMDMILGRTAPWETIVTPSVVLSKTQLAHNAMGIRDFFLCGRFDEKYRNVPEVIKKEAVLLKRQYNECDSGQSVPERISVLFNTAVAITPYLSPRELGYIWGIIERNSCASFITPVEKNWIYLFKAIGNRDAKAMVDGAKTLLRSGEIKEIIALKYVVASGMLGSLILEDKEEAFRFWSSYRPVLLMDGNPDLLFQFLLSHCVLPREAGLGLNN
ncbi:MAG: spermidine synthase [Deltaproteobacteria bacterium]